MAHHSLEWRAMVFIVRFGACHSRIFLPAREDKRGMERRHLARLSLLSLIGMFIASITMFLRGAFTNEWGVLLLIVTVLDLAQLIVWLRKR